MKTLTDEEVIQNFGDPSFWVKVDGGVGVGWEDEILELAKIPGVGLPLCWDSKILVQRFRCHKKLVNHFNLVMEELYKLPEVWITINDFGGCYQWRTKRKSRKASLSRHSWAIAIDLDVRDNPMKPFGEGNVNPKTIQIFQDHGFVWGGNFPTIYQDPMHFEFLDLSKL